MKYIDALKISTLLKEAEVKQNPSCIDEILLKAETLSGLSLLEAAILINVKDESYLEKIFSSASKVKDKIYGKRVVLFVPLYISSHCANNCLYCGFRSDNHEAQRRTLTVKEIEEETIALLNRGHKRILAVSGEFAQADEKEAVNYYCKAIEAIYRAKFGQHYIRRVNINCAPLSLSGFKELKASGIGTYQLFQETYDDETYRRVHPSGQKSDPDNRIDAIERAIVSGIDDVGMGVLFGLFDFKFELLALLAHIKQLEARFGMGPHTISVPRLEDALGAPLTNKIPYPVSDVDFKKIVSVLRLAVPYTGIILSTREKASLRDELFGLGVSQISAESRTNPGAYNTGVNKDGLEQFSTVDHRSLEQVVNILIDKGFIPSFCAACYRKERTGHKFMQLAKPGLIKGKCSLNALVTLKEYLDDFAGFTTKEKGYSLIKEKEAELDAPGRKLLEEFLHEIEGGGRDRYV